LALDSNKPLFNGEIRRRILSSYEALVKTMPAAFRVDDEGRQHDDVVITSLLKQIPGLGCVTLEKLYRAGLGSLDALFQANKEDLAAASGVSVRMCELICDKVTRHRQELETLPDDAPQSVWRDRLATVVNRLRHDIRATSAPDELRGGSASEEQLRLRQRQLYFLEITVMLAEMGELDLIDRMRTLSFKRRIQVLDQYLSELEGNVRAS
jgi:hypothetical protein